MTFSRWQWALALVLDWLMRIPVLYMIFALGLGRPDIASLLPFALVWSTFQFGCLFVAAWCVRLRNRFLMGLFTLVLANVLSIGLIVMLTSSGANSPFIPPDPKEVRFEKISFIIVLFALNVLPILVAACLGWIVHFFHRLAKTRFKNSTRS